METASDSWRRSIRDLYESFSRTDEELVLFVDNNVNTRAGTMDILVENKNQHQFWEELGSLYLAIECKNHRRPPEPQHFNQLKEVVRSRLSCSVGILVSMSSLTDSFRQRQGHAEDEGVHIFGIGVDDLGRMIETRYDEREEHLRSVLERQ